MTWETVLLRSVARVDAVHVAPEAISTSDVYVGLEHMGRNGAIDETYYPAAREIKSSKNRFDGRHILYGKLRPNLAKVARPRERGVCSTDIYPILPGRSVDRAYLAHFLLSPEAVGFAVARTAGVNLPRVSWSALGEMPIPLPPLAEQRRIAAILDEADQLRRRAECQASLLTEHAESAFLDVVAGATDIVRIGDLLESTQYGTSSKATASGETPILRMGNITRDGRIDFADMKYIDLDGRHREKYMVRKGDLLFNRTNSVDLVGKTAVYRGDEPRAFAGYLVRARTRVPEHAELISGYLNSREGKRELRRMAKSIVGMANINAQEFRRIRIPSPDDRVLARYVDELSHNREQGELLARRVRQLDALFASLQHRAFRGEL